MTPALTLAAAPDRTTLSPAAGWLLSAGIWVLTAVTINPVEREAASDIDSLDSLALAKVIVRFGALAILGYLLLAHWNDKDRRRAAHIFLPLALYWCWGLISAAWSPLRTVSLGQLLSLLTMCWLSAGIVVVDRGEATSKQLLMHMSAVLATFSLALQILALATGGSLERTDLSIVHPTTVGGTASLGIVLLLAARLIWKWSWANWLVLPGVLIHGSAMLQAHNRTAMIATAVTVAMLFITYSDRLVVSIVGLLASVVVLLVAAVDPSWQWLLTGLQSGGEFLSRNQSWQQLTAFSGREELWMLIWDSFLESPWLGHGYFVTTRAGILDVWGSSFNANAHNIVLQALASTGIIGAVIFLWALARPCRFAFSRVTENDEASRRCGLFLLVCLWLAIWGQCDVAMLGPITPFVIAFFVVLGLLAGATMEPSFPRVRGGFRT